MENQNINNNVNNTAAGGNAPAGGAWNTGANAGNAPAPQQQSWAPNDSEVDDWDSVVGDTNWQSTPDPMTIAANAAAKGGSVNIPTPGTPATKSTPFKKKKKVPLPAERDTFKENVITVTIAVVIAMIIRTLWIEPFTIPSGSMLPTLQIGDYIFVSKSSYGYSRYSLPFGLPLIKERIRYHEPEVGDVVVFKLPADTNVNYIKRIVGLPGDVVQMFNGRLVINGKTLDRKEVNKDFINLPDGSYRQVTEYIETLPNGKQHSIFETSDNEEFDKTKVMQVPFGYVFVMGDNRDNSQDSRSEEVGFIPIKNLVGKAERIFFSKTSEFSWFKFWQWPANTRTDRIGSEIE